MGYIREKKEEGVDFDNLPKGVYFFTGQEGFVKVEIDKEGNQFWDLQNWYATLDPDKDEAQEKKIIEDIKRRINSETGIISPATKRKKKSLFNPFNK